MNRGRKIALSEEQIQQAEKAKEKILADMISEQEQRLANVKHFFTLLGKMFFTPYGKEFFTYLGKQIFTS